MSRFYFNISDTKTLFDTEGAELPNWQAARIFAIRYMGEILQNDTGLVAENEDCHMEVIDENGLVMMRLDFNVLLSPAIDRTNMHEDDHAIHLAKTLSGRVISRNDKNN